MSQKILDYYHEELSYLRQEGQAFATAHPKVAGRLKLGPSHVEDPFVGRLLESFAFLSAKVRSKIDEEHASLTRSIINLLYPHYLLPIPPCSIVSFTPKDQKETFIAKNTLIQSAPINNTPCHFTTVYDTNVLPLNIDTLELKKDVATDFPRTAEVKSCLSMTLSLSDESMKLADIDLEECRFFINLERHNAFLLYTLLLYHVENIIITTEAKKGKIFSLQPRAIKGIGFDDHEALLPYPKNSFSGYRILSEYFAFPEKFLYLQLEGLTSIINESFGSSFEIHFLLSEYPKTLAKNITKQSLCLNTSPIINLFENDNIPIPYKQTQFEYHIIPNDVHNSDHIEIYSILEVTTAHDIHCAPYFGRKYSAQNKSNILYWYAYNKPCEGAGIYTRLGTETFIAISETAQLKLDPLINVQLNLKALCTNRDLTSYLPFGGDEPTLNFVEDNALISTIKTLCPISKTRYRNMDSSNETDLISHITLNQIGFDNNDDTLAALKEILQHYTFDHKTENKMIEEGLIKATIKTIQKRHPSHMKLGFCKGLEFTLTLDEHYFVDHSAFIFGSMLEHFLSKSCSINAFVQLIIHNQHDEELYRWAPRLGSKATL